MRPRKPHRATLEEVRITRGGESAALEFKDPSIRTIVFTVGPDIDQLSDQQIVDRFNDWLRESRAAAAEYHHVAVEVPPGRPQIRYFPPGDQWTPRGGVLRCVIDDGPEGQPSVWIDDREIPLDEFGHLLCTYAG